MPTQYATWWLPSPSSSLQSKGSSPASEGPSRVPSSSRCPHTCCPAGIARQQQLLHSGLWLWCGLCDPQWVPGAAGGCGQGRHLRGIPALKCAPKMAVGSWEASRSSLPACIFTLTVLLLSGNYSIRNQSSPYSPFTETQILWHFLWLQRFLYCTFSFENSLCCSE